MFSHGTLLLDSDLDAVTAALRPKPGKVESKGVKSIRSRVANIGEFLAEPLSVDELRERIVERIFGTRDRARIPTIALDDADWAAVHALVASKYGRWEWNYGENPPSNVQRARRFPAGEIDARLDVREGRIAGARLFGDFMGRRDVGELEALLVGVRYERDAVAAVLAGVTVQDFVGDVPHDDVLDLLAP
jgi:lipoate-protein ligase A